MKTGYVLTQTGIDTGIDILGKGFCQMLKDGIGQFLIVALLVFVLQNFQAEAFVTFPVFIQNIPELC